MAKHKITTCYTKSGSVFNTLAEAMESHMAASSDTATTVSDHESFVSGQTNFTEVKTLTSSGSPVSSGTAGNGYQLERTWTRAKLLAFVTAAASTANVKTEPTTIGAGWTVSHTDLNPSNNQENPIWGGDDSDVADGASYGTAGI
mgnify:CR=1 FL=1